MKKKIKATLQIGREVSYTVEREISENQVLQELGVEILASAIENGWAKENGVEKRLVNLEDGKFPLWVNLGNVNEKIEVISPQFYINERGEIVFLSMYEPLFHHWTYDQLVNLKENNYIIGNSSEIIYSIPGGMGAAGPSQWLELAEQIGAVIGLGKIAYDGAVGTKRLIKDKLLDREIQKTAKYWQKNNGVHHISQLRYFISLKGSWKLSEVEKQLHLSEEFAIKLLIALGLECEGEIWIPSYSDEAIQRRKKWEETEVLRRKLKQ